MAVLLADILETNHRRPRSRAERGLLMPQEAADARVLMRWRPLSSLPRLPGLG
ncbi:hypothetical protein CCC_01912 [Paramagnetospirillum magnetotacticum MS-1]|uniref:Uncharacterized protein n=1 Tax=Paramagnetospirillum magnetotacticum MS-1 TaxID=272627 RepID=A0A0C2YZI3_PARME|nr:hypothetical protein CCC_01912 [Paramagnetospirillum magnetotacticum MS-1]